MVARLFAVCMLAALVLTAGCGGGEDDDLGAVLDFCEEEKISEEACKLTYEAILSPESVVTAQLANLADGETGAVCDAYTDALRHRTRRRVPGAGSCAEALRSLRVAASDAAVGRTSRAAAIEVDGDRADVTFDDSADRRLVRAAGGSMLMRARSAGEWRVDSLGDESRGGALK